VVVSKWIYANSRILILDEPTRGIDVGAKTEIYHLINRFVQEGKVVLIISSELPELLGICTRIAVVKSGEITGEFGESKMDQEAILNAMIGGGTSFE
jgi:ABC-type sugar transport system ATPase subunit